MICYYDSMIVKKGNNDLFIHTVLGEINVDTFENIMHTYFKDFFAPFDVLSQAKYLDTKHMYILDKNK